MITEAEYERTTVTALSISFGNFIRRAKCSLKTGIPPALVFKGVDLAALEKSALHLSRLRFDSQQMAFSVAEALVIGFWQCAKQGRAAIVRHSAAGWRVRLTGGKSEGSLQ